MAQKVVGARVEGDVYQGLFFWREAAALLLPESRVERVVLEHDAVVGVDDIAVFYTPPGINAGGWLCVADYYQVKYHVDRRDYYSGQALINPDFIKSKASLLQRFRKAFDGLKSPLSEPNFRLHLASNWGWDPTDPLYGRLREFDGALPEEFFHSGPQSKMGKIRETWRAHLGMDPDEFVFFARTLRFDVDHFGRRGFRDNVYDRLRAAGLTVPDAGRASCPYDSLVQQFLMHGPNSFTGTQLRDICDQNGLTTTRGVDTPLARQIFAVRSFLRFAERVEDECTEVFCAAKHFSGRHVSLPDGWHTASQELRTYFSPPERRAKFRTQDHAILLECHGSFSLLAGYELSRNAGCLVFPIQKPGRQIWKPVDGVETTEQWAVEVDSTGHDVEDVALLISVTHDVEKDVRMYLKSANVPVKSVITVRPMAGVGQSAIKSGGHAWRLATELVSRLGSFRPHRSSRLHLFSRAPNALLFFLGQHREALGRLQLYEFDFGCETHCSYVPSITLPL